MFVLNCTHDLSTLVIKNKDLTSHERTISPFTAYLYLNPLYSSLGGSTIREDPFTKNPGFDFLRLKPL